MTNKRALVISLAISVFAVFLLFVYISNKEKTLLEMAAPIKVIVAARDIPEGTRIEPNMVEPVQIPQKYVQPGIFKDTRQVVNRNINVPVLKGTQILEPMFAVAEVAGIAARIPSDKRAFSVFVTDVTAVGELIQPGDMVDVLVTVEAGSFQDGVGISEEIITRTILENILVLAVNQTSSKRRSGGISDVSQEAEGSVFSSDRPLAATEKDQIKTLTLSLDPREVQVLNLSQEIGTIAVSLRSSFEEGQIENLPPLSAQEFLGIKKSIIPRARPAWVEIRGSESISRY